MGTSRRHERGEGDHNAERHAGERYETNGSRQCRSPGQGGASAEVRPPPLAWRREGVALDETRQFRSGVDRHEWSRA
jgi:hypothetical protein